MRRTGPVIFSGLLILVIHLPAYGKDASFRCGNTFLGNFFHNWVVQRPLVGIFLHNFKNRRNLYFDITV